MSNLSQFYSKILNVFDELDISDSQIPQRRTPKLSDKQVMALSVAAECCSIDSERHLFKQLPHSVSGRIERSVYNRRRRRLKYAIERVRQQLLAHFKESGNPIYLIDSMPVEVCKISRARRSKFSAEEQSAMPDTGYCAAQKMWYHGYKLHAVCTAEGVLQAIDLSAASVHDIHYLHDVKPQFSECVLVGDKGYLSAQWQADLLEEREIFLKTPPRRNQKEAPALPDSLRKARKRIETVFSQLCDQFMIRRNYAKSFSGLAARVLCKVVAFTCIQWMNQKQNQPISHVKMAFS